MLFTLCIACSAVLKFVRMLFTLCMACSAVFGETEVQLNLFNETSGHAFDACEIVALYSLVFRLIPLRISVYLALSPCSNV